MNDEILFYTDEINIRSVIRDILHNWWMIALAGIGAMLLVSGCTNLFYKAQYVSNATMVVSARGKGTTDAYADLTTTYEMAQVFSDIFSSNILKNMIAEEIGAKADDFRVSATIIPETNLLIVKSEGENPKIVYQALRESIEHYSEVSDYVFSNAVLDLLQSPEIPTYPSNMLAVGKYEKLGLVGGAFMMTSLIVVMSIFRNTIKTEAAAKRRIKGKKLAMIGHEEKNRTLKAKMKRLTKAILITNPVTSFGYVESFRKLAFRLHSDMKKNNQNVLLVTSISENEGKSTVASNIALALAQSGKKVMLIDMDLRRPAIYKIFDIANKKENGFWKEKIDISGGELTLVLNRKSIKNPSNYLKETDIETMVAIGRGEADYIIIDSSPINVAADTERISSFVDSALLVVRQDWSYTKNINRFIDLLENTEVDFMGYVLNDFKNQNPVGRKQYDYGYGKKYGKYGYGGYSN